MKHSALVLACCMLLAACGPPAQPPAPEPPVAQQAPTPATPQTQTVASPPAVIQVVQATQAAPSVTPLPYGKRLREVWPVAANRQPAVTTLLYSSIAPSNDETERENTITFWRANLQNLAQRQKIAEVPQVFRSGNVSFPGEVAPTGEYIAYLDVSGEIALLHIMHINSKKDRLVARGLTPSTVRGLRQFAWSPDGSRVVFQRHWQDEQGFGKAFYMYTPSTSSAPVQIAQVGGADFIGWQDNTTILILRAILGKQKLQLVSINVDTQVQKFIIDAPTTATVGFEELSPDRSKLLMSFLDGTYLLSLGEKQFTKLDIAGPLTAWSGDSQLLLALPTSNNRSTQVITVDRSQKPLSVNVLPADSGVDGHSILSASPDSRYLVVCESRMVSDSQYPYRTMLYNIPDDQWTPIGERPYCLQVLGWQ